MNFDCPANRVVLPPSQNNEAEKKKKTIQYSQATGLEDVEFAMVHNNMSNTIYRDSEYADKNGTGVCTCRGEGGYINTHQQEDLEPDTCCDSTDCTDCGSVDCGDECVIL